MKDVVKIVTLISFVALMFIKVSGFHVYSHGADDSHAIENCASCELAIEQQQNVFITPALIPFQEVILIEDITSITPQHQLIALKVVPSDFFSRPPPTAI